MIRVWGFLVGAAFAVSTLAGPGITPSTAHRKAKSHSSSATARKSAVKVPVQDPAAMVAGRAEQADRDFLAARDAFRAGDAAKLDKLAPSLSAHVLAPYVRYWQLKLRIDEADPDVVRDFLESSKDSLLAQRLRKDWLKSLGKRASWDLFAQEFPLVEDEDTELVCYSLGHRLSTQAAEAMAEAKRLWMTGSDTPDSCEPLFDAMFDQGVLDDRDIWSRFELAAAANNFNLVRSINARLPGLRRIDPRALERAHRDPERTLVRNEFRGSTVAGRELALFALYRALAPAGRSGVEAVGEAWTKARDQLPSHEAEVGNAAVAYALARRLSPSALEWYRASGSAPLSDAQLAWKARAALREQAWDDVLQAIDAMSAAQQLETTWRYWKARSLAAKGNATDSRALFEYLAAEVSFYGLLAAEETGVAELPKSDPVLPTASELEAFDELPSIQRMLKFYQLDLRSEALREWIWTLRGYDDRKRLLAAQFALGKGLFDRAINTADTTVLRHDFGLRYMTPYREPLEGAAREAGLDEALVFGIVRQESRFRADAVSGAGAVGLMQLMPPTARWVAKQLGQNDYRPSQIGDVGVNARFGAFYFKYWLDKFENLPLLAVAGYNAGPARAQAWRGRRAIEGAIYAETIPFNETREYVKKVLANAVVYGRQLGDTPSLKSLLAVIPPKGGQLDEITTAGQAETDK